MRDEGSKRNLMALKCFRLSGIWLFLLIAGCSDHSGLFSRLDTSEPPGKWTGIGDYEPCYLKLSRTTRPSIQVNCFTIDGILFTHSNRFVNFNRIFGEPWVDTVARDKQIMVLIQNKGYKLEAHLITDKEHRLEILENRDYDPVPDGIQVFMLLPPPVASE